MTLLDDRRAEIEEILSFNADIRALERAGHSPAALFSEECQEGMGCDRSVYRCRDYIQISDDEIVRTHVYRHADGSYECGDGDNPPDPEAVEEAISAVLDAASKHLPSFLQTKERNVRFKR